MAYAGARVPKVAKRRVCITAPPDLQLLCNQYTPVRAMLDIWPALPIVIEGL
jgi:hypothetical protein